MFLMNTQQPLWNQHLCAAFSLPPPPVFWTLQSVCIHWWKQKQRKQNLHAMAREELLQLSSLTERKAGYLLTTFTWINVCTPTHTIIYTCKQMCVEQHWSFSCLWSFENLCSNMWMTGQALGECSTSSAPLNPVGSDYSCEPSRNGEGIYFTTLCWILSEKDSCL